MPSFATALSALAAHTTADDWGDLTAATTFDDWLTLN